MEYMSTICAISTAPGGAIGIIRISGPKAITITERIFTPAGKNTPKLSCRPANTLTFGYIKNDNNEIIDEVLVSLLEAPHSYTVKIPLKYLVMVPGIFLQQVMQLLIKNGCRAAGPGEYTQRAFLNGKIGLEPG